VAKKTDRYHKQKRGARLQGLTRSGKGSNIITPRKKKNETKGFVVFARKRGVKKKNGFGINSYSTLEFEVKPKKNSQGARCRVQTITPSTADKHRTEREVVEDRRANI